MKYLPTDYECLCSFPLKGQSTPGQVLETMSLRLCSPVPLPCLLHALRGLSAGGYITLPAGGDALTVDSPVGLTEAGRRAVAISGFRRLLGEQRALRRSELRFCAMERPATGDVSLPSVEADGFARVTAKLLEESNMIVPPLFEITGDEEALTVTLHRPGVPASETVSDAVSVSEAAALLLSGLRDLIDTAHALVTESPRVRKVALHGSDKSLLISLAQAADEQGGVDFRMTVSPIRFNRQRFIGKRDGELDYAQCGDPLLVVETASAWQFAYFGVLWSALARPDLWSEADLDKLSDLHRRAMTE